MAVMIQDNFTGGIGEGSKRVYTGAFQDGLGIDFRSDPDWLRILPRLVKISDNSGADEVTGLPKWGIEFGSKKYAYDDDGKIYEITSLDAVNLLHTVASSNGQGMESFNDELWYASATKIGKTSGLSGSPSFTDDYFGTPAFEAPDYAVTASAANTYQLQTSITETSAHKLSFTATATSCVGLVLNITARGTGVWTVTLHNSSDVALASVSIQNADLPATGLVRFIFGPTIQLTASQVYHFHVTVSTGTSTIRSSTTNDISTAEGAVLRYLADIDADVTDEPTPSTAISLPNAYAVPTAISETAAALCEFTPELRNLRGISVLIQDKGTSANWTLTVHDSLNTTIGTASITNANLRTRATWNMFEFSTPLILTPGATYHFHLTASNTTGTPDVVTDTASDLSTVFFKTYTPVLASDDDYHPMKQFLNLLCVGNGRSLLTIDDSEVVEFEALTFPIGESVRCLETIGDYLAISTWKGGDIGAFGSSRVYLWDGTSPTFNAFLDIDGQVNAMKNDSNKLVIIHGTQCSISYYTGGITKMRKLKNVGIDVTVEVMPGAVAVYEGLLHFGLTNSSSDELDTCVYSYGRKDKDYPYALSKDYPISTGTKDSDMEIGMILAVGTGQFYVGWRDSSTGDCGIDKIDLTKKQQYADVVLARYDAEDPNREKELLGASLRFAPLAYDTTPNPDSYEKITLKYRYDGKDTWSTLGTVDPLNVAEDRNIRYKSFPQPEDTRWFEIEWWIIIESNTTSNADQIIFEMEFNKLAEFQIGTKE